MWQSLLIYALNQAAVYFAAFMQAFFVQRADDPRFVTFTMDSINLIEAAHKDWPWTEKLKAVVEGWDENGVHNKGSVEYAKEIGLDLERAVAVTAASALHKQVMADIDSGVRSLTDVVLINLTERIVPIADVHVAIKA